MTYLQQLNNIMGDLPFMVQMDIHKRIGDWAASGGSCEENDPYIKQQLRFAENVLKRAASKS
ncbi:hypothetical protein COE51_06330 [Bacillus pseudomycoides]|nr:hypothetical protein COE51_06330 [Bacillus pseudomycoides]